MVQPGVCSTPISQWADQSLGNNGSDFACSRTDSMSSRAISRWENFARNNECCGIGTEVLEEVAKTVERKQPACGDLVETEPNDREEDCKNEEPTDLNGLPSDGVDGCHRNPVTWDKAGSR